MTADTPDVLSHRAEVRFSPFPGGSAPDAGSDDRLSPPVWAGIAAALAALSYLLARAVGLGPAPGPFAYWPIQGILCGVFFRRRPRDWVYIALAAVLSQSLVIYLVRGNLAGGSTVFGAIAGVTQAMVAAWCLRRYGSNDGPLCRPRDLAVFVVIAVVLIPLVVTPFTALAFAPGLELPFRTAWWPLFVGNSLSMLLFAPLAMQRAGWIRHVGDQARAGMTETMVGQAAIVILAVLTFGGPDNWLRYVALPYAMFPLLVWAALRSGPSWTSVAVVSVATISAWFTARGRGPFAISADALDNRVLHLQAYLAFVALTALLLSALSEQLRRALERTALENSIREALFDSAGAVIGLRDLEGRYVLVNQKFEDVHGVERMHILGRAPAAFMSEEDAQVSTTHDRRVVDRGSALTFNESLAMKDGARRHFVTTRFPVRVLGGAIRYVGTISRDVTAERELDDRLKRVQRVGILGQLAAGLAHDLNNLLTVVLNNADLVRSEPGLPASSVELLNEVLDASQQAARMTSRLLSLGRSRSPERVLVSVDDTLLKLEPMLQILVRGNIELTLRPNAPSSPILADVMSIEQVVLNLVSNARDAIDDDGSIVIATEVIGSSGQSESRQLRLRVSDTGVGMDEATVARLFEPFFTTKGEAKGTGLGLYTTSLLVRELGGSIRAESVPGTGTTFVVDFPVG